MGRKKQKTKNQTQNPDLKLPKMTRLLLVCLVAALVATLARATASVMPGYSPISYSLGEKVSC